MYGTKPHTGAFLLLLQLFYNNIWRKNRPFIRLYTDSHLHNELVFIQIFASGLSELKRIRTPYKRRILLSLLCGYGPTTVCVYSDARFFPVANV
jgi:hypothetical protein